jgi:hypothetical protein
MKNIINFNQFLNEGFLDDLLEEQIIDLRDRLIEFIDLGYKEDESKFKINYLKNDGSRSYINNADIFILNITLYKNVNDYLDHKIKADSNIIETFHLIDKLTAVYKKVFFNINMTSNLDKLELSLYILEDIDKESQKKDLEIEEKSKIKNTIKNRINKFYIDVEKSLTPKIKDKAFKNILGEINHGSIGNIEDGFVFRPFNTKDIPKSVIKLNMDKIDNISLPSIFEKEIREATQEDIDRVAKSMELNNTDRSNLEKRYLGLNVIILKYDYKKLFDYYFNY